LFEKHKSDERLLFTQGIYDLEKLNYLRAFCNLYVHGHSVGGTNPSLLEAMAAGTPICAHYNRFNKGVLGDDAVYFDSTYDLSQHFITFERERAKTWIENNRAKVKDE
jgi:glycosyltransferase involved in cell wall biosynthesis